jgi:hypothetical protein
MSGYISKHGSERSTSARRRKSEIELEVSSYEGYVGGSTSLPFK